MRMSYSKCLLFLLFISTSASAQTETEIVAKVRAAHEALLTENGTSTALEAIWDRNKPGEKFLLREFLLGQLRTKLAAQDYDGIGQTGAFIIKKIYSPGDKEIVEVLVEVLTAPIGREIVSVLGELSDTFHHKSNNVPDISSSTGIRNKTFGEIAADVDPELTKLYQKHSGILMLNSYTSQFASNPRFFSPAVIPSVVHNIKEALSNWDSEVRIAGLNVVVSILQNAVPGVIDNELLGLCYNSTDVEQEQRVRMVIQRLVSEVPPPLTDHVIARREYYLKTIDETLRWLMGDESRKVRLSRDYFLKMTTALSMRAPVVNEVYVQKIIDMIETAQFRGFDLENQRENIQYFWDLAGKLLRTDLTAKLRRLFPNHIQCANTYIH
jgi:hypothetical protein